jgi:predicted enzyme involved in methoxymalonyl-ACP biosynthesis
VSDRIGDYGLVGAAVIVDAEIAGFAISCRALGMGIEHRFLRHILNECNEIAQSLLARIIPTPRNIPARNLYRDNGFAEAEPGLWRFEKAIVVGEGRASEAVE